MNFFVDWSSINGNCLFWALFEKFGMNSTSLKLSKSSNFLYQKSFYRSSVFFPWLCNFWILCIFHALKHTNLSFGTVFSLIIRCVIPMLQGCQNLQIVKIFCRFQSFFAVVIPRIHSTMIWINNFPPVKASTCRILLIYLLLRSKSGYAGK